jgi:hypothetical protein
MDEKAAKLVIDNIAHICMQIVDADNYVMYILSDETRILCTIERYYLKKSRLLMRAAECRLFQDMTK